MGSQVVAARDDPVGEVGGGAVAGAICDQALLARAIANCRNRLVFSN